MCGIAGEVGRVSGGGRRRLRVGRMIESLAHRGPDEQTFWQNNQEESSGISVALGMCRLAIIDREDGHQPFGKKCKVFFNGEIYNHKAIRNNLREGCGVYCRTQCDSEVIAKLYEQDGEQFIYRLDGMFAIAVWDEGENRLKLFRDRIGKKPLYYYHGKNIFLFASEIKAILDHPEYKKEINVDALRTYIALQYVPEPETAFVGIKQVKPGGSVEYDPETDRVIEYQYHKFAPVNNPIPVTPGRVRAFVEDAIRKRLESEVPLGVYLSGGIDSAIVTAVAAKRIKELHTFTMGFLESEFDETSASRGVSAFYGTDHHEEKVTSINLANMANEIVEQYDQPFGDCSAIPTMLLARLSKKYITVALSGDGGDEVFGGYPRYWMSQNQIERYWQNMAVMPPGLLESIWPDRERMAESENYINDYIEPKNPNGLMFCDMKTYLPNDIIVKMERATMAASVEARCPFLDKKVIELGLSIPKEQKINSNSGKLILKEAFRDVLPAGVTTLPKRGFGVPMDTWLAQSEGVLLMADTILSKDSFAPMESKINRASVKMMVDEHLSRRHAHGHRLWILIMLEMWLRRNF